jgi:hypothetical protein
MGAAITSQAKGGGEFVPLEGTPVCYHCKESKFIKAEILNMSTMKAVFECVSCGLLRMTKPEEIDVWAKMKGRIAPQPPQSCATTIDHELVARSTAINFQ